MDEVSAGSAPLTESVATMSARDVASSSISAPLLADPAALLSVSTNFAALTRTDSGSIPPDTMGAVGPNHFVEVINGVVGFYSRAGVKLSGVTLDSFFNVTIGPTTYPRNHAFDPHVLYDRHSGRWFASALEFGPLVLGNHAQNGIILTVSRTSDPTGVWDKYFVDVGESFSFTDFDTLGLDDNGVYFGMHITLNDGSDDFAKIAATGKASLLAASPSLGPVFTTSEIRDMSESPQPTYNFDAVGPTDRAWFVSSSTTTFGNVNYRTLTWSGGTPLLSAFSSVVSTDLYGPVVDFTPSGSTAPIDAGEDTMQSAVIRNNQLWTARTVGVNATGGSTSVNRNAVEWIELNVTSAAATKIQAGRVYDNAVSAARDYIDPSIMVNGQGHMAIGFSGGKSGEFMGTYATGRLSTDALGTTQSVVQLKAGQAAYTALDSTGRNRWGDYSATSLDPNDDMSMWTVQEYATSTANVWGTYVSDMVAPAPTLNNPGASSTQGQNGVVVNLVGTGFYDPGAAFPNRLGVQFTGGAVNGITVTNFAFNSSTSVTVTINVAANASTGTRNIVLTNPDGQAITAMGGFTVAAGGATGGISGQVFEDRNGNGAFDGGELTSNNVSVFLDTNNNGSLDNGESSVTTSGAGNYAFNGLAAGTYHLREVVPTNYVPTTPANGAVDVVVGSTVVTQNIGNFPTAYTGTASADNYLLRLDAATSTKVEVLVGGVLTYTMAKVSVPSLSVALGGADDTFTIDYANGAPIPAGGVFYDGGAGNNDELVIAGSAANDAVTLSNAFAGPNAGNIALNDRATGAQTVESVTFNANDGNDSLTVVSAPAAAIAFNGGFDPADLDTLTLNAGSYSFNTDAQITTANLALNVNNAGTSVVFDDSQHLGSLAIGNAQVTLASDGSRVIDTKALSITGTGRLDLTNNDLIVRNGTLGTLAGSAYTGVAGLIQSGRNGGGWNGNGIITTSANGNLTGLGLARASDLFGSATAEFAGETVSGNDVLVKYTYGGDANLDGKINVDDYGKIDFNVNLSTSGWYNGDFNYDGKINVDDYGIIDFNVGIQGAPL